MHCPHCHHNGSRVVDSRPTDEGRVIRRRRECENCGFRFTTFERIEVTPLLVIKRTGPEKNLIVKRSCAVSFARLKSDRWEWTS